jgi:hypothetical protein
VQEQLLKKNNEKTTALIVDDDIDTLTVTLGAWNMEASKFILL